MRHVRLARRLASGIDERKRCSAPWKRWPDGRNRCGLVCGTGFEDRTQLLAAPRRDVGGCSATARETVARVKDPSSFAATVSRPATFRIPNVRWRSQRRRRIGSPSASAVPAAPTSPARPADKPRARSITSEKSQARRYRRCFSPTAARIACSDSVRNGRRHAAPAVRYGGAVRPARLRRHRRRACCRGATGSLPRCRLSGLNSADFLVDGENFWLLEINPRPGATLDIFEPPRGSLFALHVAACDGATDRTAPVYRDGAMAAAIVYAEHDIAAVARARLAGLDRRPAASPAARSRLASRCVPSMLAVRTAAGARAARRRAASNWFSLCTRARQR